MGRFVLASYSSPGHYRTIAGVVQELVAAGHEVLYVSESPVAKAAELGCRAITLGFAKPPVPSGEDRARLADDPANEVAWRRAGLLVHAKAQVDPFRAIIREFRPDVVAADSMMHAAFIAAHVEGVRSASILRANLNPFLHEYETPLRAEALGLTPELVAMFAEYGAPAEFRILQYISPTLNVSFTTEALIGADADVPPHTVLAGPSVPLEPPRDFPFDQLATDRPVVYVSFGTLNSWQPELIRIVATAAEPLGVQLVVSCGALAETAHVHNLPGNPLVASYVPQPLVLQRTSVFVTHAGAGSLMDACVAGVPLLGVPITADQPANGHLISDIAKIGITIGPTELRVENCRAALQALLAEPSEFRDRMAPIRASYRSRDGGKVAAEVLGRLANTGPGTGAVPSGAAGVA